MDPHRSCLAAAGPFGATVAHGYLTLALAGTFAPELLDVRGAGSVVNYGCDRIRFISPVRVGSRLQAHCLIADAQTVTGGVQMTLDLSIAADGAARPACVVRSRLRYFSVILRPWHYVAWRGNDRAHALGNGE